MNVSPHRRNPPGVAILRRWRSILIGLGFTSAAVVLCYEPIKVDGGGLEFQVTSAFAKEGNNGNGRGGGNGKGSSNAGGSGTASSSEPVVARRSHRPKFQVNRSILSTGRRSEGRAACCRPLEFLFSPTVAFVVSVAARAQPIAACVATPVAMVRVVAVAIAGPAFAATPIPIAVAATCPVAAAPLTRVTGVAVTLVVPCPLSS